MKTDTAGKQFQLRYSTRSSKFFSSPFGTIFPTALCLDLNLTHFYMFSCCRFINESEKSLFILSFGLGMIWVEKLGGFWCVLGSRCFCWVGCWIIHKLYKTQNDRNLLCNHIKPTVLVRIKLQTLVGAALHGIR